MQATLRRTVTVLGLGAAIGATAAARRGGPPVEAGLARTPPMGWNSWNNVGCNVSDALIRGVIIADSVRFPQGIKALANYVHSKGLGFGIYTDAGGRPARDGRAAMVTR